MTDPVNGSVRIGTYALEVGAFTESYAAFEPKREDRNVKALRDALAEEPDGLHTPVAALEKLQANAETVTRKCERAHELSRAAAEGRLLESDTLMAEVDSLLRLAERLDRDGRFNGELRLLRALHGLLVLARRWLDLIRALRRALAAAEQAGDLAAQAWVRHELGSLHLCADEPEAAAEQLRQARQLQQRLGQATGTCATRHNLDSAQRDLATRAAIKPWSRRLLRVAVVAGVLTLLAGGGTAIAIAQDDDSPSPAPLTSTTTGTSETTEATTPSTTTGTSETTEATTTSTTGTSTPICSNGEDDDGDGLTDGDDPDCDAGEALPEVCDNDIDDDGDGLIDGRDPDCRPLPEVCDNDIDDDGDGLIDGRDSDCRPLPEVCDNEIDDDGDGLIDGRDPDCRPPPEVCGNSEDDDGDGLVDEGCVD
jgi:hypothetical protein